MHIRLINRILSIYLPFSLLVLFYLIERQDYPFDKFYEIDALLGLILPFLVVTIVQTNFFIKRINRRRAHLEEAKLINPVFVEKTIYPERFSIFNIRISVNSDTIDIYDELSFKFCANKIDKTVEVKSIFKNRKYTSYDIDSILFEFDNIYCFTLSKRGKTIWSGSFSIVLKNRKIVHLCNLRSVRDHLMEPEEYRDMDTDENYYKIGLKILGILTNELNMNYSIIDYTKKATGWQRLSYQAHG